ncbi:hypothetical protein ACQYZY_20050 [Pseudomonas aeruginosa]|uniref:hypothetical protein n=1 Tax=Pseudomonas aeruginosa TaxID=287 RepID=UPI003D299F2B
MTKCDSSTISFLSSNRWRNRFSSTPAKRRAATAWTATWTSTSTRTAILAGEPGGEKSHYSLLAIPGERVIHRQYLAGAQEWHSLPAELASINPMVLDSELAVFFRRAFDLRLEGPERRHPAGFW